MKIYVLTLFPEILEPFISSSIIREAKEKGLVEFHLINFRSFAKDRHKTVDDVPYGGGSGMIIKVEPVYEAYCSIPESVRKNAETIILTPRAPLFNQAVANELAKNENIILIAGHYKDFDERVFILTGARRLSVGDYVLSSGEVPAMVVIDAVVRLIPGVIGDLDSAKTDSFGEENPFLGYPMYTRPAVFMGLEVPKVLLSGDHKRIALWRKKESIRETYRYRSDIFNRVQLTNEEKKLLDEVLREEGRLN